ncbi:MAG: RHS repeat-associated core domain-containing protein [Bacteroidales bacterium]|jgi:RHS repeat-associated protein|nr:M15 family metallopeptidase [Bacteroidales bacterium]MDI9575060.1 RHS repeat-associated core domain-containing protein [Bacteroidota bacterium]MDD3755661.1 M15 family metallopeptidase [Bacteroidales bacterium]MDY0401502.1 RHS repeat-associated core domain-containing protein [Bacteroidales bacterium]HHW59093.1 hypothetical protein [Bacteroidales bacterium]
MFTAKELDNETSYTYFGARYYDADLSIWLSVDPMSDKYPSLSPYCYSTWNPLVFKDIKGLDLVKVVVPANKDASKTKTIMVDSKIADKVHDFAYAMNAKYGLVITSAFRSKEYQENLIKKWDSGDHSGLAVRPASTSAHSSGFALDFNVKEVFGLTSSNINTETNKELVKELTDFAAEYGFSYGGNYKKPDPPHFYINESDYGYENRNEAIEVNDQYLKNHTEDNIPYYNPNKNENNNKKNE